MTGEDVIEVNGKTALGKTVKQIRTAYGATQKELANELGVSQFAVHQYEAGKISIVKFKEIMNVMGYDVSLILKRVDKNARKLPKEIQISI